MVFSQNKVFIKNKIGFLSGRIFIFLWTLWIKEMVSSESYTGGYKEREEEMVGRILLNLIT